MKIELRLAQIGDLVSIQALFVETVDQVCSGDYNAEALRAWISGASKADFWIDKLKSQYFLVAIHEERILGFASLENEDYVDLLYIHKDFQRRGIADKLLASIEREAKGKGADSLRSDVSKTARGFFERRGYHVLREQTRTIDGLAISNYQMKKVLDHFKIT